MDNMIQFTKKTGQEVMKKVKDTSNIVEKTLLIQEEREKQNDYFTSIGHIYYEAVLNQEIEVSESLEELVNIIKESDERIQKYELEIQRLSNVRICPNCNAEFGTDSMFCSKCGTRLVDGTSESKKCCRKCGAELGDDDRFCFSCGAKIE